MTAPLTPTPKGTGPRIDELVGIDPGWTGHLSTDEYVARQRERGGPPSLDELLRHAADTAGPEPAGDPLRDDLRRLVYDAVDAADWDAVEAADGDISRGLAHLAADAVAPHVTGLLDRARRIACRLEQEVAEQDRVITGHEADTARRINNRLEHAAQAIEAGPALADSAAATAVMFSARIVRDLKAGGS